MRQPKAWRSKVATQLALVEAGFWLVSARLLLALLPFPRLMLLLTHPSRRAEIQGDERIRKRKQVRGAIFTMRRRLHNQTTCLHRALAAQMMLRRRGVSTVLYFGAARLSTQGLTVHAWVQDGEEGVIGYHTAQRDRYYVVARYPEHPKSTTFRQQPGDEHGSIQEGSG